MKNNFVKHKKNLKNIIFNSYRKFKSYVYYASSLTHLKVIISQFESSETGMEKSFQLIENILLHPKKFSNEINRLINKISYKVLPKFIHSKPDSDEQIVSNLPALQSIDKVNLFICAPIELFILDTLWTTIYGRLFSDYSVFSQNVKSNKIVYNLYDTKVYDVLESTNFKSLQVFEYYVKQYQKWKNGALRHINRLYNTEKDSVLFSLDLTNYYYSVDINFVELKKEISTENDIRVYEFKNLNNVVEGIYEKYSKLVANIRSDVNGNTPLPIGLMSSCLLGNYYLDKFDKSILALNPKYYSRYVDDMLIVFEDDKKKSSISDYIEAYFDKLLVKYNGIYTLSEYPLLTIQSKKIKIIKIDHTENKAGLDSLIRETINASEPNLIPDVNINIDVFLKSIYNNEKGAKIRDIEAWNMDKLNLIQFISNYIRLRKNTNRNEYTEFLLSKKKKKRFKTQYEELSYETITQLEKFFYSDIVFDIYDKWEHVFYFTVLLREDINITYELFESIKRKIGALKIETANNILIEQIKNVEKSMKNALVESLEASFALGIAVRNEKTPYKTINKLASNFRRANIFNHRMVACPLINYSNTNGSMSYHFSEYERCQKFCLGKELDDRLIKLSPRYIHMHEYFAYKNVFFTKSICEADFYNKILDEYNKICEELGKQKEDKTQLEIFNKPKKTKSDDVYNINHIKIVSKEMPDLHNLHIGLANINVEEEGIIDKEKSKITFGNLSAEMKCDLYRLLDASLTYTSELKFKIKPYLSNGKWRKLPILKREKKLKFIVFPELSVPLEWVNEISEFVKNSRIAIICGIKYFKIESRIYNLVATILPVTSELGYRNAITILREKNDYSPLEKRVIERQKLEYNNNKTARYDIFEFEGIDFSVFNCYELTDIYARAHMKSRLDLMFIPEYNEDISYFSNIIESSSRDIYCFIAQVNSSNFGDTRIIAPFDDKRKNIINIKGGEKRSLHVGKINLKEFREYQEHEKTTDHKKSLDAQIAAENEPETFRKYKKTSARHKTRIF